MIRRLACCFGFFTVLALYACKAKETFPAAAGEPTQDQPSGPPIGGSSGSTNESEGGSTLSDGGLVTTDGAITSCTAIALTGVVVDEEEENVQVPTGSGGTIANGTYNLTQVTKYVTATGSTGLGPTGVTYQETVLISNGTTFERVEDLGSNATAATEQRSIGIMVPVSPNLSVTFNCPLQSSEQYSYTATETSLILYTGSGGTIGESYTYTKQL